MSAAGGGGRSNVSRVRDFDLDLRAPEEEAVRCDGGDAPVLLRDRDGGDEPVLLRDREGGEDAADGLLRDREGGDSSWARPLSSLLVRPRPEEVLSDGGIRAREVVLVLHSIVEILRVLK